MKQIPISDRTMFLDLNGVRATRGCNADKVNALVDSGDLLWVFDMGQGRGKKHLRELRFWSPEIVDAFAVSKLKLADVILQILPPGRRTFNGSELCQWFLVSRPTVQKIGKEVGGVVKNGLLRVERERLADYLRQRWIGGQG
jgi:hypothetical protein